MNKEKVAVALTDYDWFSHHRDKCITNNINFWTPTPWNIKGLKHGDRLYFLLKSPIRKIGGYGYFHSYHNMSVEDAWDTYGVSNGTHNFSDLIDKVCNYVNKNSSTSFKKEHSTIGCIELYDATFFKDNSFFKPETVGWVIPNPVVKFKYFDSDLYKQNTHSA